MLYGYSTRRKGTTKIVERFCRGSNAVFNPIEDFEQNGIMPNATYVTTFGFLRGTANLFETAIRNGVNYLHIDHAYFLAGHRGWDSWYRVSKNDMNMNKITKRYPADRFMSKIYPNVTLKNWRTNPQGHILVLPPTQPTAWYTKNEDWLDKTLNWLKHNTTRPVVVRHKPPVTWCDNKGFPLPPTVVQDKINELRPLLRQTTLEQDLQDAYCVIAFNSGAVVKATLEGIPVFCTPYCAAQPIAFKFPDIESPRMLSIEPDRQGWFNALAYHQFSMEEMKNGTAWNLIREHQ